MNKVVLIGRLTRDVDTRYTQDQMCIARYTLAVDRAYKRDGEQTADFLNCVAFSNAGEFASNWFHKGMKVAVTGRIQTGSYTNRDGVKVYTTDIIIESQEFCESKEANDRARGEAMAPKAPAADDDGFINIPDEIDDMDLPFR